MGSATIENLQGTHDLAPLSIKEVAAQIGVSERTLYKLRKEGHIQSVNFRGRVCFAQADVDHFLSANFHGNSRKHSEEVGNVRQ